MEPAEIAARARKALDILDEYGWKQGMLLSPSGKRCLLGAWWQWAQRHAGNNGYTSDILPLLEEIIRQYPDFRFHGCSTAGDITWWNDAPGRKESEVRAILEKLAVKEA